MADASSTQTEYIVGLNNNPRGPFNREDLILLSRGGLVNGKTRIFVKGWEKWKTVDEVEDLASLVAENPPTAPVAVAAPVPPASAPAQLPEGWDRELHEAVGALQARLEKLGAEWERRADQLGEGQKISAVAVSEGQEGIHAALAEWKAAESGRIEGLGEQLNVLQEKTGQETARLIATLEENIAARIKPLEADREEILASVKKSLDQLQKTMAAEKEKELLSFSERIEDMDRRFAALQQAFFLSGEQLKTDFTVALQTWDVQARQQQVALAQASGERHQAMLASQSEGLQELGLLRKEMEERLEALAAERRAAGEAHVLGISKLGEGQQALQARLTEIETKQKALHEASESRQKEQSGKWEQKLGELQGLLSAQAQTFSVRMDAQLQTLQAASETRSAALANNLAETVGALRDELKEFEDSSLERYSVLLAAADDQRAIPERVARQVVEMSDEIKTRIEGSQSELKQLLESGVKQTEAVEARLTELAKAQAEHLSEEMASVQQDQLHRLQVSDEDRQQQFAALSQALNGIVGHLGEDLPARLEKMEAQLREGLEKGAASQSALAQSQQEAVRTLGERLSSELQSGQAAQQKEAARLHEVSREASREGLKQLATDVLEAAAKQSKDGQAALERLQAALEQKTDAGQQAVQELARQYMASREAVMQSLANLGGWTQSLHEKMERGLESARGDVSSFKTEVQGQMAGSHESLQARLEQMGKDLTQRQETSLEGVQARLEQMGKDLAQRQETALDLVQALGTKIPETLGGEIQAVAAKLEKRLLDGEKDLGGRMQAESHAREKQASEWAAGLGRLEERLEGGLTASRSELAQKIEDESKAQLQTTAELVKSVAQIQQMQQAQGALQKTLSEELAAGWAKRLTLLNADLAQIKSEASGRQEQLAQRLAELEGKIPAAVALQLKEQSQALQSGLSLLSQGLEAREKQAESIRLDVEKQMALHFAVQQKSVDQLLKLVQEDVAGALAVRSEALQKDVAALKNGAQAAQKSLIEELHKAVARLPDYLTESYRVTNNAMQKQLAEMAQEVSAATQQVEQSRATLEKTGSTHLSSLEEATESSRQIAATAIREAQDERQQLYNQLFQELKNWQLEQKKILAAVLKVEKKPVETGKA